MNIEIRFERPSDYEKIAIVNDQAFKGVAESKLIERVRDAVGFIPDLSIVAVVDKCVVGHLLLSPAAIVTPQERIDVLALAPMAVLPNFQRKGIGSAMLHEALKRAMQSAAKAIIVVGHPSYYPKYGFLHGKSFGLKLPFEAPDEAFMVKELFSGGLEGVQGIIQYPSPFDEIT